MSNTLRNRYRADLRELEFQLFEQAKVEEYLGKDRFEAWGRDEIRMVLEQARDFAYEVVGPLNQVGDGGCSVVDGRVRTPAGFKEAFDKTYELGFRALGAPAEFGGQGSPRVLTCLVEEMLSGSNSSFQTYSGLAFESGELLEAFGTPEQKHRYLPNMFAGKWGGTMCLTEPQAGSDVGAVSTRAVPLGDGRYRITGTKSFISCGDSDLVENIVHMVLARIEGAPAGTKGLSLFVVPRVRVHDDGTLGEFNDVALGGIEHKLGINGSATCTLNFGENDACVGELMGGVAHQGIKQMFMMMNAARLAVGIQGVAVAGSAYLAALAYARERKQGSSLENFKDPNAPKVAIVNHPDVRRMLLDMKARVEGVRALVVKVAAHADRALAFEGRDDEQVAYHKGQIELLTPIVKAYGSDQSFRVCETAIQVHGGAGYIRDYGVEQDLRDSKIFSIYEGTNHIQAMDLVGRKLGQNGGANFQALMGDVQGFCEKLRDHAAFGADVERLSKASESLMTAAMTMFGWSGGRLPLVAANANRFLEVMSEVVVGWQLLAGGALAHEALEKGSPEKAFYEGKKAAAAYFSRNVLALVPGKVDMMALEDETAVTMSDEAFATV